MDTPLTDLIRYGRDLTEQISKLTAELDEVKRRLRATVPLGETVTVDDKPLSVTVNRRWNDQQARTVIPTPLLSLCEITKLDSATAKKNLPPDLYAQCMVEAGDPVVRGLT